MVNAYPPWQIALFRWCISASSVGGKLSLDGLLWVNRYLRHAFNRHVSLTCIFDLNPLPSAYIRTTYGSITLIWSSRSSFGFSSWDNLQRWSCVLKPNIRVSYFICRVRILATQRQTVIFLFSIWPASLKFILKHLIHKCK